MSNRPQLQPGNSSSPRTDRTERLAESAARHFDKGQNIRGTAKATAAVANHLGDVTATCGAYGAKAVAKGVSDVVRSPKTHTAVRETAKFAGELAKTVVVGIVHDTVVKPAKAIKKNW